MKNTFGNSVTVTLFGESHGPAVGAVIDGLAPGIQIDEGRIEGALAKRRPSGTISTGRVEPDPITFLSGIYNGYTTGAPLTIVIENQNTRSSDYDALLDTPRPSHADFTAHEKYHGYEDRRGGGHFSGRVTAALVAAGAILSGALEQLGIRIGTHILSIKDECEGAMQGTVEELEALAKRSFPTLDESAGERMMQVIRDAKAMGDSVGGVLESEILGLPAGLGEPFFDSVESVLSHLLFSVGGVKGVSFGAGFDITEKYGSEANDPFGMQNGKIVTKKNDAGGILGGITSGMPVTVRCAVKPTPSIAKEQTSVSYERGESTPISIGGRHDPCIVHRVAAVVDAMLAIGIADLITVRFGTDALKEGF